MNKYFAHKTERGWEIAERYNGEIYTESEQTSVVYPTKAACNAAIETQANESARMAGDQRAYASGMDYACGYRD